MPEAENEVRQSKYWAQCEVDAYGYQTGRCIDLNPYMYCAVHWQTCAVGARRPLSTNWNACGTRLNDIVCSGAVD